jgi:hypothetical protein
MLRSPSQEAQWSSRWPSTRIAYVVRVVFMRMLLNAADPVASVGRCERRRRAGASDRPLGDGEVDDPPGALGEVAAKFAGAE